MGERAFLCYIRLPDTHAAITVVDGRTEVHALPPAAEVEDAVAKLAYSARMNVLSNAPFPEHGPAGPAALVDRLLIEPVSAAVGDRPLVIAPAPYAQALPWGLLPGMRGRAISVVPSARAWLTRAGRVGYGLHHRAMFAAGRDLEGASAEIRSLLRLHPGAVALTGPAA
ncbi:CHAT domain-containing protein, partial [Klebsiella pneumoniae]